MKKRQINLKDWKKQKQLYTKTQPSSFSFFFSIGKGQKDSLTKNVYKEYTKRPKKGKKKHEPQPKRDTLSIPIMSTQRSSHKSAVQIFRVSCPNKKEANKHYQLLTIIKISTLIVSYTQLFLGCLHTRARRGFLSRLYYGE